MLELDLTSDLGPESRTYEEIEGALRAIVPELALFTFETRSNAHAARPSTDEKARS